MDPSYNIKKELQTVKGIQNSKQVIYWAEALKG